MTSLPANPSLSEARPEAAAKTLCTHCSLPVPPGLIVTDAEHQFCCGGCEAVYGIIHGQGLERYYDMRRSVEKSQAAVPARNTDYAAFDDPAFVEHYVTTNDDGTARATLALEGLHCLACVWLIERLPRVVPGAIEATVSFGRATVDVRWDPGKARLSDVARGLHALGYPAAPPRGQAQDAERRADARRQLIRIGVAGALAGNIMLVTIALYAGVFEGIDETFFNFFRWISAILGLLCLAWPGRVFFRGAIAAVRTRTPHLDLPIAIALAAGGVWGLFNTLRGAGEIYFDSLSALVFLLLVGRFVQSQQQRRASDAVDLLLTLAPGLVRVVRPDGEVETKPVEAVVIGDAAEVHPGETIPIDGLIETGESEVDQAILTGESTPTRVRPGSEVFAGAVNLVTTLRIRVTAVGESTRAARLMRLVADAMATKAPIVQLADRVAGYFVLVVSSLALITAIGWSFIDPHTAMDHATALLIVTCPCALGLATPLVLSAAIGRLARLGILVKGGEQLERLSRPGTVFLDKTGTLTTGIMSVAEWCAPEPTQRRLRTIEAGSNHPIARAVAESGPHAGDTAAESRHLLGGGATGTVEDVVIAAGTRAFLESTDVAVLDTHADWAGRAAELGLTPVLIAENGTTVGGVALADTLRPEAHELVRGLQTAGWTVGLLSGDDARVVSNAARQVGIDPDLAMGRVSPEDKLAAVRDALDSAEPRARTRGPRGATAPPVVMVGDGVNDAAALAAADVGIAVQGGADASLDAAGVSIQRGGLDAIAELIRASRDAMRRIRLCLVASFSYNAIAAALAVSGYIHPLVAAVLMPLSSITVVAIAASAPRTRTPVAQEGTPACPSS